MSLAHSPRLADWREYVDLVDLTPKARRKAEQAIRDAEQDWSSRHEQWYRTRFQANRAERDEKVIGACDSMVEELDEMISGLREGRLTTADANSLWRTIDGQIPLIVEVHNTVLDREEKLAEDATLTADDFQELKLSEQSDLIPRTRLVDLLEEQKPLGAFHGGGALVPTRRGAASGGIDPSDRTE